MKSNLTPAQLRILALGLLGCLGVGGINWLGFSFLGDAQQEALALADRLGKPGLGSLLQTPEGIAGAKRDVGELDKIQKNLDLIRVEKVLPLEAATSEMRGEGQEWSRDPGKWKDELIQTQSRLTKKSLEMPENRKVFFAKDFYLGLEAYRQKSPSPEETPRVAQELSIAARLVDLLLDSRSARETYPTPCNLLQLSGPSTRSEAKSEPGSPGGVAEPLLFELQFEGSPEVLFEFVHRLSTDSWPLLVRNIEVQNELLIFPSRSEIRKNLESEGAKERVENQAPTGKKLLLVLAGKEKLAVKMSIEFIPWLGPPAGKQPPAPSG